MDAEFFIRDIEVRLNQIRAEREQNILRLSLDFIGLVRLRIRSRGVNFEEQPFTPYSDSYARQREKEGYQSKRVDFTKTGAMLNSITPTIIRSLEGTTIVQIKARDQNQQDKLNFQVTKLQRAPRGNILKPTQKEILFLQDQFFKINQKYLQ
jgi:hypothetical protein